jgi:hypothetical protein
VCRREKYFEDGHKGTQLQPVPVRWVDDRLVLDVWRDADDHRMRDAG